MKTQELIQATRVKQAPKCVAELNKSVGNGKRMNAKKAMDSYGSGAHTRLRHHLPVSSQYKGGWPWVRGKRGCGLAVGKRGSLFWSSRSSSFGGNVLLG